MTGHSESTGKAQALSSDSVRRVSQYQTAGTNARLKLFALLAVQGVPASEADDLVAALEAGAVAGAQSEVVEMDGMTPASQGPVFAGGWDEGVTAVSEALVGIADRDWDRRGGWSAGAAELAVHIADVRQRERVGLERLEAFVRETVLPRTYPHTMERRRVLERWVRLIGCATPAPLSTPPVTSSSAPARPATTRAMPPLREKPEGWHKCSARTWIDDRPCNYPHTAA